VCGSRFERKPRAFGHKGPLIGHGWHGPWLSLCNTQMTPRGRLRRPRRSETHALTLKLQAAGRTARPGARFPSPPRPRVLRVEYRPFDDDRAIACADDRHLQLTARRCVLRLHEAERDVLGDSMPVGPGGHGAHQLVAGVERIPAVGTGNPALDNHGHEPGIDPVAALLA